jgi:hypothetical protein
MGAIADQTNINKGSAAAKAARPKPVATLAIATIFVLFPSQS